MYAPALEDLAEAAALFRPEWERTAGADGYVSLEVPPQVLAEAGVDAGILAERLQREGAGRFSTDWAALLSAITEKAGMSPGPSGA